MVTDADDFRERLWEVREVLMFSFDFELLATPLTPAAYATPHPWLPAFDVPGSDYSIVARDAMGGVYARCNLTGTAQTRFVHVDTMGYAVPLGGTLEQLVSLILALPYWRELLARTDQATPEAMRQVAAGLEQEVAEDLPQLRAARDDLLQHLDLPELDDPVTILHDVAVASEPALAVVSPHGWAYERPWLRAAIGGK